MDFNIMIINNTTTIGRLRCNIEELESDLFFSLTDYLNNYFISNNPEKILEFYNDFDTREQLIEWMKQRPKGAHYIREVEGDKDIVVVIPTSDYNGKFAKKCREELYKGIQIIFVESGEFPDPYFNYGHNCNLGITRAIEYNPKWVIISNDDMEMIDTVEVLREQLLKLDEQRYDVVFTEPSRYHSSPEKFAVPNILYYLYYNTVNINYRRVLLKLYKKYGVKYLMAPKAGKFSKLLKKGYEYTEIQSFGIYSSNWIAKTNGKLYDESFINAAEDTDLSIRIRYGQVRTIKINYRIGDLIGSTLGTGTPRELRSVASISYLNYKWALSMEKVMKDSSWLPHN